MSILLIISSIILYLIVGGVVLGLSDRAIGKEGGDGYLSRRVIFALLWPVVIILGLVISLFIFLFQQIPARIRGGKK